LQGKGRTSEKRKTKKDSGATRFSFFLNLVTGIKEENGLMASFSHSKRGKKCGKRYERSFFVFIAAVPSTKNEKRGGFPFFLLPSAVRKTN